MMKPKNKTKVSLYAQDGDIWMNQTQIAEPFATSKQNIGAHISNILKEKELYKDSVIKDYFTTAQDGKDYLVSYYSLDMILAIGFRVRGKRGTQMFFAQTQNKLLYAVTGRTAAEVILDRANAQDSNMGLTSWKIRLKKFMLFLIKTEKKLKPL